MMNTPHLAVGVQHPGTPPIGAARALRLRPVLAFCCSLTVLSWPESGAAAGIVSLEDPATTTWDGNRRIDGGRVDMGAYEARAPGGTVFLFR